MVEERKLNEVGACLASLEKMIERAQRLSEVYDRPGREADERKYVMSYSEVRSLDLLCKDALERALPDHLELANKWIVHPKYDIQVPSDLLQDLLVNRTILQHAYSLIETEVAGHLRTSEGGLPRGYTKLADPVQLLFEDSDHNCQDYDRNVFIMTRFKYGNKALTELDEVIRGTLQARGLVGHRADDRCYPNDRNLWDNVCTYMFCCKYGVAVLENQIVDEFNPNVALEYGFMRAWSKPTLLLKEQRFSPRADILGTVWHEFDMYELKRTVPDALNKWLDDLGVASRKPE
jgi:hypothetical protein